MIKAVGVIAVISTILNGAMTRGDDRVQIQGTWKIRSVVNEFGDVTDPGFTNNIWEISEKTITMSYPDGGRSNFKVVIDPTKNAIDLMGNRDTALDGENVQRGIYRFHDGHLQVCIGPITHSGTEGQPSIASVRPTSFDAKQAYLITLRKVRK